MLTGDIQLLVRQNFYHSAVSGYIKQKSGESVDLVSQFSLISKVKGGPEIVAHKSKGASISIQKKKSLVSCLTNKGELINDEIGWDYFQSNEEPRGSPCNYFDTGNLLILLAGLKLLILEENVALMAKLEFFLLMEEQVFLVIGLSFREKSDFFQKIILLHAKRCLLVNFTRIDQTSKVYQTTGWVYADVDLE